MQIKMLLSCLVAAFVLLLGSVQAQDLAVDQTRASAGFNRGSVGVMMNWNVWGDPYGPNWINMPPPPSSYKGFGQPYKPVEQR